MHPIPLFACRTHIHKGLARGVGGQWQTFLSLGFHRGRRAPVVSHILLPSPASQSAGLAGTPSCRRAGPVRPWRRGLCVPGRRGLRAELPEVRPWICSSFRAARGPAAVYDCEGRERDGSRDWGRGLGNGVGGGTQWTGTLENLTNDHSQRAVTAPNLVTDFYVP